MRRCQVFGRFRRIVQPRAVDKIRVEQAQLLRALIHHADERALAARYMLRQRRGAVVCGAYDDGFEHFVHAHLLARLQIDLAAALGTGGLRGDDGVVPADAAGVQRFHDEQQRRGLRHGRRAQPPEAFFFHRAPCPLRHPSGWRRARAIRPAARTGGAAASSIAAVRRAVSHFRISISSPAWFLGTSVCGERDAHAAFVQEAGSHPAPSIIHRFFPMIRQVFVEMVYDIRKERLKMQNSCVRVKGRRKMPIQKMMRVRSSEKEKTISMLRLPAELSLETLGNGTRHQSVRCLQDGAWKNLCYGRDRGCSASLHFNCRCEICAMNSVIA